MGFGRDVRLARKDTEFVQQYTALLHARAAQTDAYSGLVRSRIELAKTLSSLHSLDEICSYAYERGRRERAHDLTMLDLEHAAEETQAHARLIEAHQQIERLLPPPTTPSLAFPAPSSAPPPAPRAEPGVTIDDVNAIAAQLPEIPEEARKHLSILLANLLREKQQ